MLDCCSLNNQEIVCLKVISQVKLKSDPIYTIYIYAYTVHTANQCTNGDDIQCEMACFILKIDREIMWLIVTE